MVASHEATYLTYHVNQITSAKVVTLCEVGDKMLSFPPDRLTRAVSIAQEVEIKPSMKDQYRVVVMGSSRVGKTAIIKRFLDQIFPEEHVPTIEELYTTEYKIGGVLFKLNILDTSGSYEFPAMRRLAISSSDAFLLVYSIENTESFEEVRRLRNSVLEARSSSVPIVVVGNKNDLEENRLIRKELAETIVCIDWEHGFVESSAKNNTNVTNIFRELFSEYHLKCEKPPTTTKGRRRSLPVNIIPLYFKEKPILKRNSCGVS
ncbi:ras-related protein Rap-1b-like isoform X2 [Tachypleus tridentatus]|uniref:ras-related protein Rap-1b-like isoform X2 n=1 Tax=Tachypleus tridentatus TaxID=6853 RepID=UPI003FD55668